MLFNKSKHKSWKMCSGAWVSLWSRGQSRPPGPPGCLIVEDLRTLHIPHKQETRGLDTIQATSFFPWWQLLFFQECFEAKGGILYKVLKSGKSWQITDLRVIIPFLKLTSELFLGNIDTIISFTEEVFTSKIYHLVIKYFEFNQFYTGANFIELLSRENCLPEIFA